MGRSGRVECREPGLRVDEQVAAVLARIRPVAAAIRALTASGDFSAGVQIVRYFADDDGETETVERVVTGDGRVLERLSGQHQLLGWHLDAGDLAFLASLPAELDVDEYG